MVEPKRKKRKKKQVERVERRLAPVLSQRTKLLLGAAGVGAALLGAGVYGQFRQQLGLALPGVEGAMKYGSYVLGGGAVLLAIITLVLPDAAKPLVVGDGGVGVDNGESGVKRVPWCDIESITLKNDAIVVIGPRAVTMTAPLEGHADAAAWIVAEADERVPDIVNLSKAERSRVGKPSETAGEVYEVEEPQVIGRHCAESGEPISYEPDARVCPRCGEVYLHDHLPEECVTCGGPLDAPIILTEGAA